MPLIGGFVWYVVRTVYMLLVKHMITKSYVGNPSQQATMAVMCLFSLIVTFWLGLVSFPLLRYRVSSVVFALEEFRSKNGSYPAYITELVPEYLESVPSCFPPGFSPLHYYYWKKEEGEGFDITCPIVMFERARYDSKAGWSTYD
jgi:hypothetical protein